MKEGNEHELNKEQFVRIIEQLTREHGNQSFYAIEQGGVIFDMLQYQRLLSVEEVISSHKFHSETMTMDASKYDEFEMDDFDMTRLVVVSRLTKKMKDASRICFDHDPHFYYYPGLADPNSVTAHVDYRKYGPIPLIAWLQKEQKAIVTDHEWPALASKFPQSNNAMNITSGLGPNKGGDRTCYVCHKVGHIAPHCPQKTDKIHHGENTMKTNNAKGGPPKRE
jgi:hypothetical protein